MRREGARRGRLGAALGVALWLGIAASPPARAQGAAPGLPGEAPAYDPPLLVQFGVRFGDDFLGIHQPPVPYHDSSRIEVLWQAAEPRTVGHGERFPDGRPNLDTGSPLIVPRFFYPRGASPYRFASGIAVGREAYVPEEFDEPVVDPDDRPFAGWLYVALMTRVTRHDGLWQDAFEVDAGIIGPSALGELVKTGESMTENRVPDEPALMIAWDRRWMVGLWDPEDDFRGWLSPKIGVRLGSPYTDLAAGLTVLVGWRTPRDWRPGQATTPSPPELGSRKDPERGVLVPEYRQTHDGGSFYAFAGVEGRAIAYDAMLDGTLSRESPSADRKAFVGDAFWGLGLHVGGTYWSVMQVLRSPELRHDESTRSFGVFQFTVTLGF